ncbi:hypothetical protein BV22DRAFT_158719 [Leucogyrophana mollusca]|uniref:Uncharacterized protein n=1 Tax=Leucogyrophana mollusca TaxID=85980 RepID=A0ACB8BWI5_9AGAM|nr:hypothetical protein BV22DRAFT_158719 [Leucogyrophana mollusca]
MGGRPSEIAPVGGASSSIGTRPSEIAPVGGASSSTGSAERPPPLPSPHFYFTDRWIVRTAPGTPPHAVHALSRSNSSRIRAIRLPTRHTQANTTCRSNCHTP